MVIIAQVVLGRPTQDGIDAVPFLMVRCAWRFGIPIYHIRHAY